MGPLLQSPLGGPFREVLLYLVIYSSHVMTAPRTDRPYQLYTDACDYVEGAILVQVDNSGIERVIQYVSQSLSRVKCRWATFEKEAYAVVYAISGLQIGGLHIMVGLHPHK